MRLLLIRHGESLHAHRHTIAGMGSCPGLTAQGVDQAHKLAERFRRTEELAACSLLLSSPVRRARHTAEILAEAMHLPLAEPDCDLCELHVGQVDGLSWDTYRATYGAFDLVADPTRPFAPEAESWLTFTNRVQCTLERLAQQCAGQTVVAVTHAGFIVASLLVLFAIPRPGTRASLHPDPASITEWAYDQARWNLIRYNETG